MRRRIRGQQLLPCIEVFICCVEAIHTNKLIKRVNASDKEFHFQNWFAERLKETQLNFEAGGRNSYPDFRLVAFTEGYEVKGLAYPGRQATYDSNSQVPSGLHNGRTIFYVFGRYPAQPDGNKYPVLDLMICHGDFLNANHEYVHENKSVKGFGSYGDIMIRDRKMYVCPTPFALVDGATHTQTLILPSEYSADPRLKRVGELRRRECKKQVIGYGFDLRDNTLSPKLVRNPNAVREHLFSAYRVKDSTGDEVTMRATAARKNNF